MRGQLRRLAEDGQEVLAVGLGRVAGDVEGVVVARERQPVARTGEARRVDEAVVLEEADEHAGEDPGDGRLGEVVLAPDLVGLGGAARAARARSYSSRTGASTSGFVAAALAQVALEVLQQPLQVGEQARAVDHRGTSTTG